MTVTLTQHDSRLLSLAVLYVLGITGSGNAGADAMASLPNYGKSLLNDATNMLSAAAEGLDGNAKVMPNKERFLDNLNRLKELGLMLMGDEPVEATPVVRKSIQAIDAEGNVTGPKQYQLWL